MTSSPPSSPPSTKPDAPAPAKPKAKRGFAAMTPEMQRSIASKGGKTAHERGTAHEFSREEAIAAGKKGGHAAQVTKQKKLAAVGVCDCGATEVYKGKCQSCIDGSRR